MSSGEEIHYFADAEISGGVEPPGVGDVGERDGLPFPRRRREPAGTIAARVREEPTGRSPSWLMGRSEAEMAARGWGAGGEEAAMEGDLNGDDNLPAAAGEQIARAPRDRRDSWYRLRGEARRCQKPRRDAAGRRGKQAAVGGRWRCRRRGAALRHSAVVATPCTVGRCGGRKSISARGRTD
jgi:hypothetical protein